MVAIVRDGETKTIDAATRQHSGGKQFIYHWKRQFGQMEVWEGRELRQLGQVPPPRIAANAAFALKAGEDFVVSSLPSSASFAEKNIPQEISLNIRNLLPNDWGHC